MFYLRKTARRSEKIRSMPYLLQRISLQGTDSRRKKGKLVRGGLDKNDRSYRRYAHTYQKRAYG